MGKLVHLVIGIGEVGAAVAQVLADENYIVHMLDKNENQLSVKIDILHICFPFSNKFEELLKQYQEIYKPQLTIIYSSVPIFTTKQFFKTVHSPIEGRHPRLYYGVKHFKRYIGANNIEDAELAEEIWQPITEVKILMDSNHTEFLKLASTSKYGINIVWAEYMNKTAENLGMAYHIVKSWDVAYNKLYKGMNLPDYQKYILDPPKGKIGGHCIVPNAEVLDNQYPNEMLKMIKEMK